MASVFSHAVAALSIGACFYYPRIPKRVWALGALCSALPDLDVIGFGFGIRYGDFWGHRGFTHSLVFAGIVALAATGILAGVRTFNRYLMWTYLFLATASHGLLDALTNGGLGVAFFAPFDNRRYFLPWTPIRVSPIGIEPFFTARGWSVLQNEMLWIWIPSAFFAVAVYVLRRDSLNKTSKMVEG